MDKGADARKMILNDSIGRMISFWYWRLRHHPWRECPHRSLPCQPGSLPTFSINEVGYAVRVLSKLALESSRRTVPRVRYLLRLTREEIEATRGIGEKTIAVLDAFLVYHDHYYGLSLDTGKKRVVRAMPLFSAIGKWQEDCPVLESITESTFTRIKHLLASAAMPGSRDEGCGIWDTTVQDLLKMTREQIEAISGIGPRSMEVLEAFLDHCQLTLVDGWPVIS